MSEDSCMVREHAVGLTDAAARCDRLRAQLDAALAAVAPVAAEARSTLRSEIAALIRSVDAEVEAWRALAESARALPALWKQLPDPFPAAPAAPRLASSRSDHLGASTFVAKGWTAYAGSDFAAAEAAFDRALALAPDDPETVAMLAWARAAGGHEDEALLAAMQVLVARPHGAAASLARVAVGRVCLSKGIVGEAIEHLARVVRDNDDRRATLYATFSLGVAYQRREMYEDSVAFLRRALALGPNLVEARYELGCTHWRAGALEDACVEWQTGAAGTFSPWASRCRDRLVEIERGLAVGV